MPNKRKTWRLKLWEEIRSNSLSIAFFWLFLVCIIAQSFTGLETQNDMLAAHGFPVLDYWDYLSTGAFIDGLAVNWQAAVLQLGSLIIFSSFLYQHGSPHSRLDRKENKEPKRRHHGYFSWLYRHSLSISFLLLFVITMMLHIVFGAKATNEMNMITGGEMHLVGSRWHIDRASDRVCAGWVLPIDGIWPAKHRRAQLTEGVFCPFAQIRASDCGTSEITDFENVLTRNYANGGYIPKPRGAVRPRTLDYLH